jgi:hypothetical protein
MSAQTNHVRQIKELALTVSDSLSSYITVHDAIFRDAASFKSLLKNLFGRGVPMSKLLEDSERLLPQWEVIHQKVETFRHSNYSSLSKDEKCYFDILSRYVAAVRKTVAALIDRQRLMAEGSKSRANNPMTLEAYKQKEKIYQTAVQEYTAIGQELNMAAPIIFG